MKKSRILIVEDQVRLANSLGYNLKALGYSVPAIAFSANDAIRQVEEYGPDLVLMDINLEREMDGIEAAEKIRSLYDIPVVYLTGYGDDETLDRAKATGPFGYLVKPVGMTELRSTIEIALCKHAWHQELKESEARYRSIVQDQTEPVFWWAPDERLTFVNQATCRCFGRKADELIGRTFVEFVPEEDRGAFTGFLSSLTSECPVGTREIRVVATGDEIRWLRCTIRAMFDKKDRLAGFWSAGHDITHQKEMEDQIRVRLTREAAIAQASRLFISPEGADLQEVLKVLGEAFSMDSACLISLDKEGKDESVCEWHSGAPGLKPKLTSADLIPVPSRMSRLRQGESVTVRDNKADDMSINANGGNGCVVLVAVPIHSIAGRFAGFMRFDKAQAGREWFAEDMQAFRVIADMVGIHWERRRIEEKLLKAVESADMANRAKSEFLANISHEIRTPLNAILGMTELTLGTEMTDEQREYLETVKVSADALLYLLNDLLDFSKIEAGYLQLEEVSFDLNAVLENAVDTLAFKAHEKGLELIYGIKNDVPDLLIGDPGRLRQIIVNLGSNAVKFTEKGQVLISCEVVDRMEEFVVLHFAVSDTGIGIPGDKLEVIFDSFSQVDGSAARRYGGTGLGLSISRQLAERLGGRIWAESEPGKGSTFHYTMQAHLAADRAQRHHPTGPDLERLSSADMRALIVDDNATTVDVLLEMISSLGMACKGIVDRQSALLEIKTAAEAGSPYNLVLLDSQAPLMDEVAFVESLRSLSLSPSPVVILMILKGEQKRAPPKTLSGQITACISKPVKRSDLFSLLARVIGEESGTGAPPTINPPEPRPLLEQEAFQKPRILLAEDNPANRKLVLKILEKHGCNVSTAGNGKEVLDLMERDPFDLILMDIQMPVMDGLETARVIRSQERLTGKRVRIIAMTAHAMKEHRERCLEAGMDGFISKPIKLSELSCAISQIESRSQEKSGDAQAEDEKRRSFLDKALDSFGGDYDLVKEAIGLFLEDYPAHLETMRKAISDDDARGLAKAAHKFKGSIATLLIPRINGLTFELKGAGEEKRFDQATKIVDEMESRLKEFVSSVKYLPELSLP
ncbi:MAG: response regulator [Pseudomonadota bacterium]